MYFELQFPVRYYETDQMQVVHHSNYVRYFELARNEMMAAYGLPVERCEQEIGIVFPVVDLTCKFRTPARMGDTLTATAAIDEVPLAKLRIRQSVRNQRGEVCAEGTVTLGFLDTKTFRPVRCPEEIARMIESNL